MDAQETGTITTITTIIIIIISPPQPALCTTLWKNPINIDNANSLIHKGLSVYIALFHP